MPCPRFFWQVSRKQEIWLGLEEEFINFHSTLCAPLEALLLCESERPEVDNFVHQLHSSNGALQSTSCNSTHRLVLLEQNRKCCSIVVA